jgi:hypothetical protein
MGVALIDHLVDRGSHSDNVEVTATRADGERIQRHRPMPSGVTSWPSPSLAA